MDTVTVTFSKEEVISIIDNTLQGAIGNLLELRMHRAVNDLNYNPFQDEALNLLESELRLLQRKFIIALPESNNPKVNP